LLLLAQPHQLSAQQTAEPLLDQLTQTFRTRALRLNLFLQVLGDFQDERSTGEGNSGFTIPRGRFSVRGELDGGISYALEAYFSRSTVLNDAWLRIALNEFMAVDMGQFKAPFSGERLMSSSALDFITRSQIVRALAPGRNVGVQLRGTVASAGLGYMLGAFNGNGQRSLSNDNNDLMYAGRLTWRTNPFSGASAGDGIEIGVNALTSHDQALTLGYSLGSTFTGVRTLHGADIRVQRGPLSLNAEFIGSRLEDTGDDEVNRPNGYQTSVSYRVAEKHKLHFRWDSIDGDGLRSDRDMAILGWSHQMTTPVKWQMNLVLPSGAGTGTEQLLAMVQVVF
jgi:phosphate-selective porin